MRSRSTLLVVMMTAAAVVTLTACKSSTTADSGGTVTGASSTTAPAPTTPAKAALPTNGKCQLISAEKAASLLGEPAKGSSAGVTNTEFVHIDGCSYIGATKNLGYDINAYTQGLSASQSLAFAKSAMSARPGVTAFDVPGGDGSLGFTFPAGARTLAQIEIAKGQYTIVLNASAASADEAKQIALAGGAFLLAAIS